MLPPQYIQQIAVWLQQGYSIDQIRDLLKQQGFKNDEIEDAIAKAQTSIARKVSLEEDVIEKKIEEMTEAVVEEKWAELVETVNKFLDWKKEIDQKIIQLDTQIKEMKESIKTLQEGVMGKISEYDDHLIKIGSNVRALEKVFQKIIPTFTENVNELARIVEKLKKE